MSYFFMNVIQLFLISFAVAKQIRPRVVGGVEDTDKEFPFAVMIQAADPPTYRTCSGSIIAPTWVLTASHCVPKRHEKIRVKYGDTTIPSNETKFLAKVIKAIRHPGYTVIFKVKNDIGLLQTEKMMNPTLAKLYAVDYRALMGLPVKYAGFGRSKLLAKGQVQPVIDLKIDLDPPLQTGEAVVISCKQDEGLSSGSPAICVAPRCGPQQLSYFGDSGGPLLHSGRIIGVNNGVGTRAIPIVGFCPVSPYLDWIYDTIRAD